MILDDLVSTLPVKIQIQNKISKVYKACFNALVSEVSL